MRQAGATLTGYDPALRHADGTEIDGIGVEADPYRAATGADAVVVLTEWPEFRMLDWPRIAELTRAPIVVDTRNLLDPDVVRVLGSPGSASDGADLDKPKFRDGL